MNGPLGPDPTRSAHVPSGDLQEVRQEELGRMWPARRPGDAWRSQGRPLPMARGRAANELPRPTLRPLISPRHPAGRDGGVGPGRRSPETPAPSMTPSASRLLALIAPWIPSGVLLPIPPRVSTEGRSHVQSCDVCAVREDDLERMRRARGRCDARRSGRAAMRLHLRSPLASSARHRASASVMTPHRGPARHVVIEPPR